MSDKHLDIGRTYDGRTEKVIFRSRLTPKKFAGDVNLKERLGDFSNLLFFNACICNGQFFVYCFIANILSLSSRGATGGRWGRAPPPALLTLAKEMFPSYYNMCM